MRPSTPCRIMRSAAGGLQRLPWWGVAVCALLAAMPQETQATITVGIHFVESPEIIDFLPQSQDPYIVHQIEPLNLTDPANRFVTEGALAGANEAEVRQAIYERTVSKFFSIPTPANYELDLDLVYGEVAGSKAVNAILGRHNHYFSWFGSTVLDAGLGTPNGQNLAAIAVDRIDDMLPVTFTEYDDVVAGISNITAHEIGHLVSLDHVCASGSASGCGSLPVVTNPYDIMATGPSGLPSQGWVADNIFTTVPGTQSLGNSSVDELIAKVGLRLIGDIDVDGDVDTADITTTMQNFTGDVGFSGGKLRIHGDFDHDRDVDTADITTVLQNFTGVQTASMGQNAQLVYDPGSGEVHIETTGLAFSAFSLQSNGQFTQDADFSMMIETFGAAPTLVDNTASAIGWVAPWGEVHSATLGLSDAPSSIDLGAILPSGLDLASLEGLLTFYAWSGQEGGGGSFDLVVQHVPEPSALWIVLGGIAVIPLLRRRFSAPH